ncbi:MAG TPA: DUF222 domain-containing protein, partial [Egicoccus sp.]
TAVVTRDIDEADDATLRDELQLLTRMRNRLDARMSTVMSALSRRDAARARVARPDNPRAGEQAARQLRNDLVDDLGLTHGEVKQAQQLDKGLADAPSTRAAFAEGALGPRHAAVVADCLRHVADPQVAARLDAELTAAAVRMNPVEFGKYARGRLIELDNAAAEEAAQAKRMRRTGRLNLTPDGYQQLFVRLPGIAGETLATAVHAFRRPDSPGEHRTPDQATADAVVAMAEAALAAAAAPHQHGVRPHVVVTVSEESVARGRGAADTVWSGPLPFGEVDDTLDDSAVCRLVHDARGVPTEASEGVRTVPVGVYRGIVDRDGGCIADGCDQKPQWCQVMHLDVPFRFQGRLTIRTAALGCSYHHDKFDRRGWKITWFDGRPVLHHPDKPPRRPQSRGDPP